MPSKKTYPFEGRMVPGESVEFDSVAEPFTQYKLADGSTVKVKTVLLDAIRLEGHNANGDPLYQFQFQQIIGVIAPDELKRKPQ